MQGRGGEHRSLLYSVLALTPTLTLLCPVFLSPPPLPPPKQVTYQGTRRFKLLTVDNQSQPYPVGAATWYDDDAPAGPTQQQLIDQLELDVYRMLKQVASYSQQLTAAAAAASTSSDSDTDEQQQPSSSSGANASTAAAQQQYLPPSVLMYAPPPPGKQSVAEYLIRSGHPAGGQIATWQRLGSVYSGDATNKQKPSQDPYQVGSGSNIEAGACGERVHVYLGLCTLSCALLICPSVSSSQVGWVASLPVPFGRLTSPCCSAPCSATACCMFVCLQLARENVGKERRQELFSFAAASVLELGLPERLALLQCQDTAARLQFVAAAVQPHLADLVARVSLQQALVKP